jgi:hypothetical protein
VVTGEFDAELVEGDAGVEQFGLQVVQGLVFHPFGGAGVQVACGVESGVGADAGWCEPELVGGVGDLGVLAVGDTDGQAFLPAGEHVGAAASAGRFGAHRGGQRRRRVGRLRSVARVDPLYQMVSPAGAFGLVQPAGGTAGHQVVADEDAAGAQHPDRLTDGGLPVDHMVQHDERQHRVEAVVRER